MGQKSIAFIGHHELDYPRNRTIRDAFIKHGFALHHCHSQISFPWRFLHLAFLWFKKGRNTKWIWISEGGHRLVPFFKFLTLFSRQKIIFDPFTSRYNTRIEDRKIHEANSLQALVCLWQDWSACKAADYLVFDTQEHKEYFYKKYSLKKNHVIIPVLIPEEIFYPQNTLKLKSNRTSVLFYGTYIPLQGIEWIIKAAEILKDEALQFEFIGQGQTFTQMQQLIQKLDLTNIILTAPISEKELADKIHQADILLGIFGDTDKAGRVVANKVVQSAAMKKPIITRKSSAIETYFAHKQSILLVEEANPVNLAEEIRALSQNKFLQQSLGKNAEQVFKSSFSQSALGNKLNEICSN